MDGQPSGSLSGLGLFIGITLNCDSCDPLKLILVQRKSAVLTGLAPSKKQIIKIWTTKFSVDDQEELELIEEGDGEAERRKDRYTKLYAGRNPFYWGRRR